MFKSYIGESFLLFFFVFCCWSTLYAISNLLAVGKRGWGWTRTKIWVKSSLQSYINGHCLQYIFLSGTAVSGIDFLSLVGADKIIGHSMQRYIGYLPIDPQHVDLYDTINSVKLFSMFSGISLFFFLFFNCAWEDLKNDWTSNSFPTKLSAPLNFWHTAHNSLFLHRRKEPYHTSA